MNTDKHTTVTDTDDGRQNESLWRTPDVARYLQVGESTVRRYVEKFGLPFHRVVGGVRYDPEEVKQWAKSNRNTDAA
jgi:excisionase family DNA binding protein